jgi:hypothetical protein
MSKGTYVCLTTWGTIVDLGWFDCEQDAEKHAKAGGLEGLILDEHSLGALYDDVALSLAKAHVRKIERIIKP